jgi:hypothetical protein
MTSAFCGLKGLMKLATLSVVGLAITGMVKPIKIKYAR